VIVVIGTNPPAVSAGASATSAITITAGSTYAGTMNVTCALTASPANAQSLPTCGLNPASVAIASGGSGGTVLTVNTTAAKYSSLSRPAPMNSWERGAGGAALAGLLMFCISSRRRRWIPMLALMLIAAVMGAVGCSGGSSGGGGGGTLITPATTSGSYTFSVTGTDSVNSTITTSTAVVVTVQ
jgi:hypothetical protein